ncbi:hypothetical protein CCMSSC00406_0010094 [Pleurotus cornucopiae]|uniref:Uncharacterized protein n=1 Tax=Pleurotus cornucopiae TaxID=5321 RepID=A0ACB7IJG1_PLECO|nr:hypothetical protein CCMSSC00406_0010094 [Pleurotus cornucopiae]
MQGKEWITNTGTDEFMLLHWPEAGPGESSFYRPLVKLLNAIIDEFGALYPADDQKYSFKDVRFVVYDRVLQGIATAP